MDPRNLLQEVAVALERARQRPLENQIERARKTRSTSRRISARVWADKVREDGFARLTSKDARPVAQDGLVSAEEARAQHKLERYLEKRRQAK